MLRDPVATRHVRLAAQFGAQVRIAPDEITETILVDRRVMIMTGDTAGGQRSFSVVRAPDVVRAVGSLFDAAWRAAPSWTSTTAS